MSWLDAPAVSRLQSEFRRSMRTLLIELCRDLHRHYAELTPLYSVPVDYFRFVADRLDRTAFSNWKVVGWIEALNDWVYFLDLLAQVRRERDPRGFAEQLFAECEEQFFENSYLDELFPLGRAQASGLEGRLHRLCTRLALEMTQEALFFEPRWVLAWMKRRGLRSWAVSVCLESSYERAEEAYTIPMGIDGSALIATAPVRKAIGRPSRRVTVVFKDPHITLHIIGRSFPIGTCEGAGMHWHWPRHEAVHTAAWPLTVGPTLSYGKNREPRALSRADSIRKARISRACQAIRRAWPEGHALLALLTDRVIPLRAAGVVSFSYRHRPGLSFINCFERDNLDLIDDLIHENSHHHLNLLLRKHILYHHDRNEQIFYSPWRKSLRPLRGILHAAFTFTMGALLFARLSTWAESSDGKRYWREAGLGGQDLMRARFRCLQEIESVRYSVEDLKYARRHLKWLTAAGARLVRELEDILEKTEGQMSRHRQAVLASAYGSTLRRHVVELRYAREAYGPMPLEQV